MHHLFPAVFVLASLLSAQGPVPGLAGSASTKERGLSGEWMEAAPAKTRLEIAGVPLKGLGADAAEFALDLDLVSSWGAKLSIVATDTELEVKCSPVYGGKQSSEQEFWIPVENEDGSMEIRVLAGSGGTVTSGKKRREAKVRALIVPGGLEVGGERYVVKDGESGEESGYLVKRRVVLLRRGKLRVESEVSRVVVDGKVELGEEQGKVVVVQTFVRG